MNPWAIPLQVFVPVRPVRTRTRTREKPVPLTMGMGFDRYRYRYRLKYPRVTHGTPYRSV
jgi:hypothetical protein